MNRRNFLSAIAAGFSAAVLPSGVIMPVRKVWTPPLRGKSIWIDSGIDNLARIPEWMSGYLSPELLDKVYRAAHIKVGDRVFEDGKRIATIIAAAKGGG